MDNNRMTMDNELRIVQGNTFATAIEIHAVDATGQPIVDWSLDGSTDLRVWYVFAGREQDITTWQIDDGKLVILWLANMQRVGTYDIFCAGKYNGADWRNAMQYQFRIVRFNHEANIPANVVILDGIYQLSAELQIITQFAGGGGTPSQTLPLMDGEASVGEENAYARGDHRHPSDASKQDVIDDLSAIRSGASAGASAYQKPSTGIPKTDMAPTVQTSLEKAGTALQPSDIVNSLSSGSTTSALSANQGKILNETKQDTLTFDNVPTSGSDNPVKSGGVYDAIENVEEKLDDYAKIDGAYEGMLAGNAMNLVDTTGTPILREFVFSKSGGSEQIATGTALIKRLRGNTIVWNQLVQNGNFADEANSWTIPNYFNKTISDGVLKITARDGEKWDNLSHELSALIVGHKYYLGISLKSEGKNNLCVYFDKGGTWNNEAGRIHPTTSWDRYSLIYQISTNVTAGFKLLIRPYPIGGEAIAEDIYITNVVVFDLTQMFGAGNEPTSVAEFEAMFPLDYYEYNAGELLSFSGDSVKTVGFNQWDEEWEVGSIGENGINTIDNNRIRSKNYIRIIGGNTYYVAGARICWYEYDGTKKFLRLGFNGSFVGVNETFTPSLDAVYIRFITASAYGATYNHDICINLSDTSKNGTYEPYVVNTKDISFYKSIRDANDNILFPYGLLSAGSVYDEVTKNKAIKRVGVVDLGSLSWDYKTGTVNHYFLSAELNGLMKQPANSTTIANIICAKYPSVSYLNGIGRTDKAINGTFESGDSWIAICDTAYTDKDTFKTAMNGVMLYYELAEPIEVDIDEQNLAYPVDGGGTEQILPENTSTPTTTPARLDVNYGLDAMATLKNLQKNYLAQTDLDRLLTAEGYTYTKTWDATNNQWNFTISGNSNINNKADKVLVTNHGTSDTAYSVTPNILHIWGTVASLSLTLATPTDATIVNEYMIEFTSGSTATTLSLPSSVVWAESCGSLSVEASKTYQISIVNNIGLWASISNS